MSEIKPALTAEEWKDPNNIVWGKASAVYPWINEMGALSLGCDDSYYLEELSAEQRLALGALCLHKQPFGFTWEDVEHHRRLAGECGNSDGFSIDLLSQMEILSAWHLSMADRIQALLPPQDQ